jgi:Rrf2 family transcriptional regulator, iron-sulfur cluster assembly transcription factor
MAAPALEATAVRLTTKGRFAVTAMIDLALRSSNGPVALAAISQRQQISLSYLEQLFGKLRRHELVESTRGPGGGYSLGRPAGEITVADIIVAVDEPIDATGCSRQRELHGRGQRQVHDARSLGQPEHPHDRVPRLGVLEEARRRATGQGRFHRRGARQARHLSVPVVKPIKVTAPNSVFALGSVAGNALSK